jgi:hypothetical protein
VSVSWAAEEQKPTVKLMATKVPPTLQVSPVIKGVQVTAKLAIQTHERQNVENATRFLISQQFGSLVNTSLSVSPMVTIPRKVGNRLHVEALLLFLAKNTYTSTLSKLDYEVEGDQVFLKNKIDNYIPPIVTLQKPTAVKQTTVKLKQDMLKNIKPPALPQGYGPMALANSCNTEFASAVDGTNKVHNIFVQAFGLAEKKIGAQSTKASLMDILQKGTRLLAWNNIGHGNSDHIVEWNHETIATADFNTTTPFEGVYNSVILLNSCNVCASPYSLRNAMKQHGYRTYIGGAVSLPVGNSEYVDVIFWDETLLKNQNMAVALNDGQTQRKLAGYFCLDGYNGKFAEVQAAKFTEDCLPLNYNQVQAQNVSGRWKVVQGKEWMLDFGTRGDLAQKAVQIIRQYKLDRQCFVGRPNAPMKYWTTQGKAPQGPFPGEDCLTFNPDNLQVQNISGRWTVVGGNQAIMNFENKEGEAKIAVEIIKHYGFNHNCYVGRPNPGMMYFRK